MPIITRKFEFDYGHRVLGHEGKCASLHGHRGVAEVAIQTPTLDDLGRVVDFGVMKEIIGDWIDKYWDHTILLHLDDPLVGLVLEEGAPTEMASKVFGPKQPFFMPKGMNPTAENMVKVLVKELQQLFDNDREVKKSYLKVIHIRFWETPNCSAEWNA